MSTIATIFTIAVMAAVVMIVTTVLLTRPPRRCARPVHAPDYWRDAARACELEWSASQRD